ncbi:swarming motility protein SwrAA [Metabacillus mangrovi]|nr:swarming motility protein SwrAA [Metabacillus mangrovi]
MKRASVMREQIYRKLMGELKSQLQPSLVSNAKTSKYLHLFCMYLANYTEIKDRGAISEEIIQEYFSYLTSNYKRLSLGLSDIKRSMQLLEETLHIKIDAPLLDFSLSNSSLWGNLK